MNDAKDDGYPGGNGLSASAYSAIYELIELPSALYATNTNLYINPEVNELVVL